MRIWISQRVGDAPTVTDNSLLPQAEQTNLVKLHLSSFLSTFDIQSQLLVNYRN